MEEITIPRKEYYDLKMAEAKLDALERYGVDNWCAYGECFDEEYDSEIADLDKLLYPEEQVTRGN